MNTNMFLDNALRLYPQREAFASEDIRVTYAQLNDQVNRLTNALLGLGCAKGSRIGFLDRNCAEAVTLYYAASRLCAVFVPLDHSATIETLCYMMDTVQVDFLFCGEEHLDFVMRYRKKLPSLRHIVSLRKKAAGLMTFAELIAGADTRYYLEQTEGSELNVILFTSGLLDKPKAVALAHNNFVRLVEYLHSELRELLHSSVLLCVSFNYIVGLVAMMSPFYNGRRLIIMRQFIPDDWLVLMGQEKIAAAFLSPSYLEQVINSPLLPKTDLSALRLLQFGGDFVPPGLMEAALRAFPPHIDLQSVYGLLEATFDVSRLSSRDSACRDENGAFRNTVCLGSIGKALPGIETIVADETAGALAPGAVGELLVHSPLSMLGYIDPDSHQILPFSEYWIHTGDLGYMDKEGYIYLNGKKQSSLGPLGRQTQVCAVKVYPTVFVDHPQMDRLSESVLWENVSIDMPAMYELMRSLQALHNALELDDLQGNYMQIIPRLVKASAYGIHLAGGTQTGAETSPYAERQLMRWQSPKLDDMPVSFISVTDDGVPVDMQNQVSGYRKSASFEEFTRRTNPCHLICTPMFSPGHDLVGVLSFARNETSAKFTANEQCIIRLIANHMCVALLNASRYADLKRRSVLTDSIIQTSANAVILTGMNGIPVYANNAARKMASDDFSCFLREIQDNIRLIREQKNPSALKILVLSGLKARQYRIHTTKIKEQYSQSEFESLFVSVISSGGNGPSFQHLSGVLTPKELEILNHVAQGLGNSEIAEALHISTNTVKFHLKKLHAKLGVSSRVELLTRAYEPASN